MLDRNELDKYGPPGFHLAQKEKDYVQHWVLSFLSRSGFGGLFKGGTCLQKALDLPRYSEDLDFTLNGAHEPDLEAVTAFLSSAGFSGIVWKTEETDTSTTAKMRYRGPLYNGSAISEGTIRLEFSKREHAILTPQTATITPPYPDLLPYQILMMDKEEIAAEKIRAILTRSSARDLFDLYFLLHQETRIHKKLVDEKLKYCDAKFDVSYFKKQIKRLRALWSSEMGALSPSNISYELAAELVISEVGKRFF